MTIPVGSSHFSRRAVLKGGALTIAFALSGQCADLFAQGSSPRVLDPNQVDAFFAVNGDGTVTVFCGKVDLGQGLRIAIRQMAAEELGIGIDKIKYVEGDTALTPNQGRTSGSSGIQRGGVQIRQAAATARKALIELAAQRLGGKPDDLVAVDGEVRPKAGGTGIPFAHLIGERRFDLKIDPKAPLKDPLHLQHRRQAPPTAGRASQMYWREHLRSRFYCAWHAARPRDPASGDRCQANIG
jgi:nicotinate dehydrogenase subunit B